MKEQKECYLTSVSSKFFSLFPFFNIFSVEIYQYSIFFTKTCKKNKYCSLLYSAEQNTLRLANFIADYCCGEHRESLCVLCDFIAAALF